MTSTVRPVGRLYSIGYKYYCLERLWMTGTIFDGKATDGQIIGELNSIIADLQKVVSELEQPKENWLD